LAAPERNPNQGRNRVANAMPAALLAMSGFRHGQARTNVPAVSLTYTKDSARNWLRKRKNQS
jgi:citrate synthase